MISHLPELSFIICTIGYQKSLEEVLIRLLEIKENNDELILVINKNEKSDFPLAFLANFDHVILNPMKGISYSRNLGVRKSRHDFIAFLDDDTILPEKWREKSKDLLLFDSIAVIQFQSSAIDYSKFHNNLAQNRYVMLDAAGCILRKKAVEEVGGFDEFFRRSEDMDLGTKLYYAGWDLVFSDVATADVNIKNIFVEFRDMLISSKFEAQIIKKSHIRLGSNYLRQVIKIILDKNNKLGFKRFKFIHTYFYLLFQKNVPNYNMLPRRTECFIVAGDMLYRLMPESRIVFTDDSLMIYTMKKRDEFFRFDLNLIKIIQRFEKYYLEVPKEAFLEKPFLFSKV